MFHKKTIKDIDISGKTVLVRVDYNVPIKDGVITDDYRLKKSLPTLEYLIEKGCKIILVSHLGRPKGKIDKSLSLKPCAEQLEKLLGKNVHFAESCIGEDVKNKIRELSSGEVILLENIRFHPEEESNDEAFAKNLASYAEVFVQDAFGVVHHPSVSVSELPKHLPAVAGLLVEKEVSAITEMMENPPRPLMAIIGGAKISDKLDIINRFIDVADIVAIGGAMANTFLLAEGIEVGESLAESEEVPKAIEILGKARDKAKKGSFVFYVPQDGVVAKEMDSKAKTRIVDWGTHAIAEIENYPKHPKPEDSLVQKDEKILDVGPFSGAFIAGCTQLARSVVWNGAMGVTEIEGLQSPTGPFSHGTELIVEALMGQFGHRPKSLIGGGDTVGYVESRGLTDKFDHVSTGGGASMDLLSGKKLPGVEALQDK
ncbi:phosphoglycerate kinase [Candidatus Saccharibacteria bacterium]|nr:phosphoglycerate kinase [Candidatus Saccharibacteria bacterium]